MLRWRTWRQAREKLAAALADPDLTSMSPAALQASHERLLAAHKADQEAWEGAEQALDRWAGPI